MSAAVPPHASDLSGLPDRTLLALYPEQSDTHFVVQLLAPDRNPEVTGRYCTIVNQAELGIHKPIRHLFLHTAAVESTEPTFWDVQDARLPTLVFFPGCFVVLAEHDGALESEETYAFFLDRVEILGLRPLPPARELTDEDYTRFREDDLIELVILTTTGMVDLSLRPSSRNTEICEVVGVQGTAPELAPGHIVDVRRTPESRRLTTGTTVTVRDASTVGAGNLLTGRLIGYAVRNGYYAPRT